MKYRIIALLALVAATTAAQAKLLSDKYNYTLRLGYNLGGTLPHGMPAEIRGVNSYKPQSDFTVGIDIAKPLGRNWGVNVGLRLEEKCMKVDSEVKNYHTTMIKGGDKLEGYYTGDQLIQEDMSMITVPVEVYLNVGSRWQFRLGPYISYVSKKEFTGYVHDGYLRHLVPTGDKIIIGNTEETRGTFDFTDDMRRIQVGLEAGVDYRFSRRWGAFADLDYGITGVHKSDFHTIEQRLYPLFATLGVSYKLK